MTWGVYVTCFQLIFNICNFFYSDGVNVQGYFLWAAFDTYEFQAGYSGNWGLYHIDFNDNLKRLPTDTANWYKKYLTHNLEN